MHPHGKRSGNTYESHYEPRAYVMHTHGSWNMCPNGPINQVLAEIKQDGDPHCKLNSKNVQIMDWNRVST